MAITVLLSFALFMSFVVISLFTGAFMETYRQVDSPDLSRITLERLEEFRDSWVRCQKLVKMNLSHRPPSTAAATAHSNSSVDTEDTNGNLHPHALPPAVQPYLLPSGMLAQLLLGVPQPLGIADARPRLTRSQLVALISQLGVPDRRGYVHFHEVLVALAYRVAGVPVPVCRATKRIEKAARALPRLPARNRQYGTDAVFVAQWVQSVFRGYLVRKHRGEAAGRWAAAEMRAVIVAHAAEGKQQLPEAPRQSARRSTGRSVHFSTPSAPSSPPHSARRDVDGQSPHHHTLLDHTSL
jgi:hypothetical protein